MLFYISWPKAETQQVAASSVTDCVKRTYDIV